MLVGYSLNRRSHIPNIPDKRRKPSSNNSVVEGGVDMVEKYSNKLLHDLLTTAPDIVNSNSNQIPSSLGGLVQLRLRGFSFHLLVARDKVGVCSGVSILQKNPICHLWHFKSGTAKAFAERICRPDNEVLFEYLFLVVRQVMNTNLFNG